MKLDLRQYINPTQIDTYRIYFQPTLTNAEYAYPMTLSWPDLGAYYSNPVWLRSSNGLVNIDMKAESVFTVTEASGLFSLLIITGNAGPTINAPYNLTAAPAHVLQTSAQFMGTANPGGAGTFDATISLGNILSNTVVFLEVQDVSAADGTLLAMDSVELVVK